ncbi:MAG: hypothetical protein ACKV19_28025 [Verrucomicrobiales bacterium]
MNFLLLFGLTGWLVGLAIGLAGTYLAVDRARGPRERAFMVRAGVACWAVVAAYPAAVWLAPEHWPTVWLANAVGLPVGVLSWSRRQMTLRRLEQDVS